jgi:hypothetical protein
MIVVHIKSCKEIGRVDLTTLGRSYGALHPRFLQSPIGGTVALALGGTGIAITGEDVRGLDGPGLASWGENNTQDTHTTKNSTKKKPKYVFSKL